ncbi:hypothetical protein BDF20DRAFT_215499 [Mycotypha africana]|uniref:uncharacterized protein n=1 Tax=Mycotypha africana TaxID=64632 RepID=UPI002301C866|nr:uncharacterized protein BDF20DRAFT_215499 [Mycotypha africana]KAI8967812.1 hypothetical protein BDF20DRAFT_215499 [Mycotypha africana]
MGVSLLAYVVTFFIFICNYTLTICSIVFPRWLTFVTPVPFYMETHYGLFKLCRSITRECRVFPSYDHGDCQEEGFCELWRAAGASMILSAILGGLALFALLATMCSNRRKRSKAWAPISFLLVLYALPQIFSMSVMAYLYNSSSTFYIGTKYNVSFVLCIISWIVSILLSVILSLVAVLGPPDYSYQPL